MYRRMRSTIHRPGATRIIGPSSSETRLKVFKTNINTWPVGFDQHPHDKGGLRRKTTLENSEKRN